MNAILMFALIGIIAYLIQFLLGLGQLNNFNMYYKQLRHQGRVVIGKKFGRFKAGTIVMFAIDEDDKVLDAVKMQGVSTFSRFKALAGYQGQDIHFLDRKHPQVQKENSLLQTAIEDARETFIRVTVEGYKPEKAYSVTEHQKTMWKYKLLEIKKNLKRSGYRCNGLLILRKDLWAYLKPERMYL